MTEEDLDDLLDVLQGQRAKARVQEFLRDFKIPSTGTWDLIRTRIAEALHSKTLSEDDLLELLDDLEAYGSKHFFLYKASQSQIRECVKPAHLQAAIKKMGAPGVNARVFAFLPDEPALVACTRDENEITFKWIRKRSWWDFLGEKEESGGTIINKRYERKTARSVTILRFAPQSGLVDVRLDAHNKADYEKELEDIKKRAAPFLYLSHLDKIELAGVIRPLLDSDEVRQRRTQLAASDGTSIELISSGDKQSFTENEFFVGGMERAGDDCVGKMANVYWLPGKSGGHLTSEVHSIIYDTNEVAFSGTSTGRAEVEYVLQRIRALAAKVP